MEFTVQNNNLLYSVFFTEEIPQIGVQDLSNGLYESVITLPITVGHIIEHQRQQLSFDPACLKTSSLLFLTIILTTRQHIILLSSSNIHILLINKNLL